MGAGKTTYAKSLGLPVLSFADPVRLIVGILTLTHPSLLTQPKYKTLRVRALLRAVGMGGRSLHPDLWLWLLQARLPDCACVIDDVRFPNEADWILQQGGKLIWLDGGKSDSHVSESFSDYLLTKCSEVVTIK